MEGEQRDKRRAVHLLMDNTGDEYGLKAPAERFQANLGSPDAKRGGSPQNSAASGRLRHSASSLSPASEA